MSAFSSLGRDASSRPIAELPISFSPANTMFSATAIAIRGSSRSQPVQPTSRTATTTPPEVHTSVMRCLESAWSTIERYRSPARIRMVATAKFSKEATIEIVRPIPRSSMGWGSSSRGMAVNMINPAATRIIRPSRSAEKYSALLSPKW